MHLLGHSGGCEPISVTVCLIDWEAAKMKKVDSFGNSTLIDTNRSGLRDFRGVEESEMPSRQPSSVVQLSRSLRKLASSGKLHVVERSGLPMLVSSLSP